MYVEMSGGRVLSQCSLLGFRSNAQILLLSHINLDRYHVETDVRSRLAFFACSGYLYLRTHYFCLFWSHCVSC